jgi:predicted TIM-barrel fold metal-dependent hydrolase
MTVDCHTHILDAGWLPQSVWDGFLPLYRRLVPGDGAVDLDAVLSSIWDPRGDRLVEEMDATGVDLSVILPMDQGYDIGEATTSILVQNDLTAAAVERHPDRLVWFFGIDPRRSGALPAFERALSRGARGLKLYPPAGFSPSDAVCQPLLRLAARSGVPVLAHCGPAGAPLRSKYAHPLEWDAVAAALPDLNIILGHGGKIEAWARDAIAIAIFKPNIHLDISLWDGWYSQERLDETLMFMRDRLGADRILWGSDRFGMDDAERVRLWREAIASVPHRTTFSQAETDLVMDGNARRLLQIASSAY